jgi:type IV pilus assembly protein PilQ
MRVKRLLTVALMALFCAGSATAASQLNSVQVLPADHAATVNLRTTGSFAHKEYRPDDHLVLIDLNGVTPDAAVQRTATLSSAVLTSYKLSSYTSASGSEVTRIELVVGNGVTLQVLDKSDGLEIVLSSGAPKALPAAAPTPSSAASPLPASTTAKAAPAYARPVAKSSSPTPAPAVVTPAKPALPANSAASANSALPAAIRNVSVLRGHGTMDVIIEGPSNAPEPFLLRNPERLVLDFANTTVRSSVKNVAVKDKDVLEVRVGRHQAEPPIARVVIDLSGPRAYTVAKSAQQIIVHVKSEDSAARELPVKSSSGPALASTSTPAVTPVATASAKPSAAITTAPAKPRALASVTPKFNPDPASPAKSGGAGYQPTPDGTAFAKYTPTVTTATEKPVVVTEQAAPAPAKPVETVSPSPKPVEVASAKPVEVTPVPAPTPTPAPTPAPKPEVQAVVSAPVKLQATETPAPAVETPSAAASVVPQVHSVQERLVSESASSKLQEAAVSAPLPAPERQSSDPAVRAGFAAGTMASSPQSSQPVEMGRLASPGQLPGGSSSSASISQKYTGEPISVNLKDVDLKDFFRLIHEISGLNIVLDPSVRGNVTLVLDDVPWDQALDIVLKNNQLDRELQGNVLRIAASDTLRKEAVDRRAQSEAVALAVDRQTITRFLSYAKAKDAMPTIKKFLSARGDIISDERTNALIISDIPSVLPNLDRLISQLDRKSQEVEIEVRVVSATRSFSRDLGVQLGFSWGNGVSTIAGSNPNGATGTTSGTTTAASTVPLFTSFTAPGATSGISLSNITKSYGIDAVLTAAETHNLAKVLSRPRVVTQSNIKAEVKQGVKIPVYTASTSNANASVSYVDAVLRLSVTPQITAENTIFLTVDVENTQPSGTINSNYILTTQQATTQVLVTDGGTVVIGGVIQTTNTVSTSQTPLLGDIPWLGNLFKQRSVKTETDELIFFITPKIVQT